jgi:hypothetical protein
MRSATATSRRMLMYSILSGESAYTFDTSFGFMPKRVAIGVPGSAPEF